MLVQAKFTQQGRMGGNGETRSAAGRPRGPRSRTGCAPFQTLFFTIWTLTSTRTNSRGVVICSSVWPNRAPWAQALFACTSPANFSHRASQTGMHNSRQRWQNYTPLRQAPSLSLAIGRSILSGPHSLDQKKGVPSTPRPAIPGRTPHPACSTTAKRAALDRFRSSLSPNKEIHLPSAFPSWSAPATKAAYRLRKRAFS